MRGEGACSVAKLAGGVRGWHRRRAEVAHHDEAPSSENFLVDGATTK
jgi:hypothetical protein